MKPPVTIRAKGNCIIMGIWSAFSQMKNMMDLKEPGFG
jgi:hypothetical protein